MIWRYDTYICVYPHTYTHTIDYNFSETVDIHVAIRAIEITFY